MPVHYTIDPSTALMSEIYEGGVTLSEVRDYAEKMAIDARVADVTCSMVDLRAAHSRLSNPHDIEAFEGMLLGSLPETPIRHWAIIVESPIETALSILIKKIFERCGKDFQIFYDDASAKAYLSTLMQAR